MKYLMVLSVTFSSVFFQNELISSFRFSDRTEETLQEYIFTEEVSNILCQCGCGRKNNDSDSNADDLPPDETA